MLSHIYIFVIDLKISLIETEVFNQIVNFDGGLEFFFERELRNGSQFL
jgi:hypothetical protein